MNSESHYLGSLVENIQDQIEWLAESMLEVLKDTRQLREDITQVKKDLSVIKSVLKDQNKDIHNHEARINKL